MKINKPFPHQDFIELIWLLASSNGVIWELTYDCILKYRYPNTGGVTLTVSEKIWWDNLSITSRKLLLKELNKIKENI